MIELVRLNYKRFSSTAFAWNPLSKKVHNVRSSDVFNYGNITFSLLQVGLSKRNNIFGAG